MLLMIISKIQNLNLLESATLYTVAAIGVIEFLKGHIYRFSASILLILSYLYFK